MKPGRRLHLGEDLQGLGACVHCGFCLTACPTYRVLGDENDSPRGRLYLMGALLEGRVDVEGAFETHIGRCLGCRACEPVCPAGVEYGALLERARADIREAGGPGGLRAILEGVALGLATGPAGRALYPLLRLARRSRAPAAAGRLLPGRAGLAARLLDATRPAVALPPASAPDAGDVAGADTLRNASDPEGPSFALLEGCVMAGLFGHVHTATRSVLHRLGYREVDAPGQTCCGALHAHAGRPGAARRLAARNLDAFEASGAEWIVVDSAGCGAALEEYPAWLAGDPGRVARARRLADRVLDVTEPPADPPSGWPGGELSGRVAYDAPCHLVHAQGIRDAPLDALRRVSGLEVVPLPSSAECCGGAGIYNLRHPKLSRRVLERKVREIAEGAYDWVATGNPGCIMQIGAGLRRAGLRVPVVHPAELIAAARAEGGARGPGPPGGPTDRRRPEARRDGNAAEPRGTRRAGGRAWS